ncbi:MAG TPA: ABC transporter permease [Candidatus Acidoferrales bacterium]|nr:ABC transporter permease [Candidatus Acidoferrales bacterium]
MKQDYRENLALAVDTLRTHKLRSVLAVTGVTIGVGLIILVVGLVAGFQNSIQKEITAEGINTAWVQRFSEGIGQNGRRPKEERERKPLTLEDGESILPACPAVKQVAISIFQWELTHSVRYQNNEVQGVEFRGTFPAFLEVYSNAEMRTGRFFTDIENEHRENVADIGENIATALYGDVNDAVGKTIVVDGSEFRVIGVLEKPPGTFGMDDEDRRVILPYYTFRKLYPAAYEIFIRFLAYPGKVDTAVDQVRDVLRRRRNVPYEKHDNFFIQTNRETAQQFNDIIKGTVIVVVVLSSIGLLIGGVGVMNIMLVSVTERTREIGVRKAIGARSADITWQFLFEAMTLTGLGGLIGILFGGGGVVLIPLLTKINAIVTPWSIVAGLVVSISIGLVFGVWPAVKAARLDPVEALRYE